MTITFQFFDPLSRKMYTANFKWNSMYNNKFESISINKEDKALRFAILEVKLEGPPLVVSVILELMNQPLKQI